MSQFLRPAFSRRAFLQGAAAFTLAGSMPVKAASRKSITFGISADIHKDIMPDAEARLATYMSAMAERKPDFIVDLGDFCIPKAVNRGFIERWNQFDGPRYHVLGNHDIDGGYSWDATLDYYEMAQPYYSFYRDGWHFVVLDGNNIPPDHKGGYPAYIAPQQLEWLTEVLSITDKPTIVFSHQALFGKGGNVKNAAAVRAILESAGNVCACFSGHKHHDELTVINGSAYIGINSMSYRWVGSDYKRTRYSEWIERAYPNVSRTIPYDAPLYAVATLTPQGQLTIEGTTAEFIPPTPTDLGLPTLANGGPAPIISPRDIALSVTD